MFRNSSTYLYLAVALGLFCYVAFIDKKIPTTDERIKAETQLFEGLNPDDVNGIEITNDKGTFILEKTNGHWEILKPVLTPADGATIDGIVNQVAFTQPQRIIEVDGNSDSDKAHLKDWGLDPAVDRVVIHTKDKHFVLLIGRKMAINDSVYARASEHKDEPVRILPSSVKDVVEKDLSTLRSRNVFDFDAQKVTKVATYTTGASATPGQGQQCEIDLKDGKWTMQLPLVARASDADMQALFGKILGLRAVDFIVDDASNLSTYGLTSPAATITVALRADDGKPAEDMVLQVGGPVPNKPDQVYAQRLKSNSVFTLTKSILDDVLKAVPNVRDRHILPFDPNKPTVLSYTIGAKKLDVKSDHALWNCIGTDAGPADVTKINSILVKLSQLETTPLVKDSAPDLKPYGLDKPQGKITIESPDFVPGPTATLYIGKAENKLIYVRNSFEPFIYTVPDTTFDFLPARNADVRDPRAINLQLAQVKSMTITPGAGPAITLLRSPGGTWSPGNIKDRMVDSIKADTQAALFCQLQAQTWLGPVLPAYGLAKPVLTVAILADQPNPTILHLGATLPDGTHAAQVEGSPTAFAISDADFGALNSSSLQPIPAVLNNATNAPATTPPATNSTK
jgi:hypothetical protein